MLNYLLIAMRGDDLTEALDLNRFPKAHWMLQPTCAISGDGLIEGFLWLVSSIRNPPPGCILA